MASQRRSQRIATKEEKKDEDIIYLKRDELKLVKTADGYLCSGETYKWKDNIRSAGGKWLSEERAWLLPLDVDKSLLMKKKPVPLPPWVCCEKAEVLPYGHHSYSCPEHTQIYQEGVGTDGKPYRFLASSLVYNGIPYYGH